MKDDLREHSTSPAKKRDEEDEEMREDGEDVQNLVGTFRCLPGDLL